MRKRKKISQLCAAISKHDFEAVLNPKKTTFIAA